MSTAFARTELIDRFQHIFLVFGAEEWISLSDLKRYPSFTQNSFHIDVNRSRRSETDG